MQLNFEAFPLALESGNPLHPDTTIEGLEVFWVDQGARIDPETSTASWHRIQADEADFIDVPRSHFRHAEAAFSSSMPDADVIKAYSGPVPAVTASDAEFIAEGEREAETRISRQRFIMSAILFGHPQNKV